MFIKTLRHKYNSIGDLLYYMVRGMNDPEKDMMVSHNLPSFDIEEMKKEFLINDLYRQQTRAEVRWYHELLSFSPLDKEHLDKATLQAITEEYIERRNPNALCFAVAHTSEAHTHIHFCFSGTEYRSKKVLRMDDKTFKNLREGTERWQMKHFPELKNSIVYIDREPTKERAISRDKNRRKENEYQAKRRLKSQPLEKQELQSVLQAAFNKSENIGQFYEAIKATGIMLYERNGRPTGVIGKRKYRFGTVGITKPMLLSLDRLAKRQQEAQMLTQNDEGYERER